MVIDPILFLIRFEDSTSGNKDALEITTGNATVGKTAARFGLDYRGTALAAGEFVECILE